MPDNSPASQGFRALSPRDAKLRGMTQEQQDHFVVAERIDFQRRESNHAAFINGEGSGSEVPTQDDIEEARKNVSAAAFRNYELVEQLKRSKLSDDQIKDRLLELERESLRQAAFSRWEMRPEPDTEGSEWKAGHTHKALYAVGEAFRSFESFAQEKSLEARSWGVPRADARPASIRGDRLEAGTAFVKGAALVAPLVIGVAVAGTLGAGLAIGAAAVVADAMGRHVASKAAIALVADAAAAAAKLGRVSIKALDGSLDIAGKLSKRRASQADDDSKPGGTKPR